jgi:hypothetical protein
MYFPPYDQLLKMAGRGAAKPNNGGQVTVPRSLFEFLLQVALTTSDFDETSYLAANPDVRASLARGGELNAQQHFVGYGYFEGRKGGLPKVDERWYLQTYKDVSEAVQGGKIGSAAEHFELVGAAEGRAPSRHYQEVAKRWKVMLHGS